MEFSWTREQQALNQRMREAGAAVQGIDDLARIGALGLCIPASYGGGGRGLLDTAYAFEGLGASCPDGGLLLAAGAHLFGVAMTVARSGSDAQRARWLPDLAVGHTIATVAATEAEAGSDIAAVTTEIAPHDGGYVVRGEKRYVTFADRAGLLLVVGRAHAAGGTAAGRGLSAALVPAGDGVVAGELYPTAGLRGARLGPVRFDDVPIDDGALLGRPGAGMAVFQLAMTFERALVLAFRVGAMQRALDEAVRGVRKRGVGKHQAVSHRVARMKLRLETARLLVYRAAWMLDRNERAHADAALAKWHLAEAAAESAFDAMRLCGARGFVEPAMAAELDDCMGGTIHSGTSDVLANVVAGWLGL
jgi:alkylation response protein AidB-like acyl-CoA dehydrogenase